MLLLLLACTPVEKEAPTPEPLVLPEDPAENGVPVGVRSFSDEQVTLEIWYPASDSVAGEAGEAADFNPFVPQSVRDVLGDFSLPLVPTVAIREAPLRVPESPYPVVIFSHGFGGTRLQSVDYTTHLASRGYVVIAADHPGRMMGDIVPCLFSPPLEGCNLTGMGGQDSAVGHIQHVADLLDDWSSEGFFAGAIDPEALGLSGHSAGGGSTATVGEEDTRFKALLPMAAGASVSRDVPELLMGGTCDSFATDASILAAGEGHTLIRIAGAGHLAFSDLCTLKLKDFASTYLAGRDDINATFYDLLVQLASDGCPEALPDPELSCGETFLPLETSAPIVRHYSTVFFDEVLYEKGPGVETGIFPEVL